jgi:hypothetical protein
MNVRRSPLGAWVLAIALLAVACGAEADQNVAGVETTPATPPTSDTDQNEPEPEASDESDAAPITTEDTIAAMKAMDPEHLASLHDHDGHDGHDHGPSLREGLNSVDPDRIVIPTIGVDATIDRSTGIDADGEMEVPDFGDTAWFTPSVKPGRIGPSVITGHVDSKQGPDVFFDLKELATGDQIDIHGDDGTIVTFAVTGVEQHKKDDYPRDKVHGATDGPELRLITCGGIFDRSVGHYDDNIIVFAERITT